MPVHLRPSAPTAADAVLCGDPARALALAQELLVEPRISNHHRGLWGYHGRTGDGHELTVHATGIGGPSAAVVVHELAALGLQRAIRVGTCRSRTRELAPAAPVLVGAARPLDGTSAALGARPGEPLDLDPALTGALGERLDSVEPLTVSGGDLYYEQDGIGGGAATDPVRDLQTAALVALGQRLGIAVAALLVVAEGPGFRVEDDPLEAAVLRAGRIAAAALAATG